jgi:hypothetical protein
MRRWLLIAIPLLTLLATLAGAGPAQAYNLGGGRWPGSPARITYYEATGAKYRSTIALAAAAWNTSGVRVRFIRVSSRSSADVLIKSSSSLPTGSGYATVGYAPNAFIELNMGTFDKWTFAGVVAHEMGHILGLEHVQRICALMTPVVYENCKPEWPPNAWQWRCRVLQKDDLAGAASRYGGRTKLRPNMWCDKAPTLPAVSSMTVTQENSSPLRISKVTAKLPARRAKRVAVLRRAGTCPKSPTDVNAEYVGQLTGKPGASVSLYDDTFSALAAGTYCYRAWTYDEWDRAGGDATAELDYTGPPPVPVADVTTVVQNTRIHPGPGQDPIYLDVTVNAPTASWVAGADVWMKQGSCPANHNDGTYLGTVQTGAGQHQLYGADVPAAGSWCVAAFSYDSSNRYAATGATVTFVYTPPAAPAPTNGSAKAVGADEQISWTWPATRPSIATLGRFTGACPGTITRANIDSADYQASVDGAGTATWTDYAPVSGTYCLALYDIDTWGYYSSVLEIQYTVPFAPAPTGGKASLVGSDVNVTWKWPAPVPNYATVARVDGPCPGTITRDDVDSAALAYVAGTDAASWTDYGPSSGTYCAALYDTDGVGHVSSVLEIQYTVP